MALVDLGKEGLKPSFKKSECLNYLIHNACSWFFRLIFRFWKNQPLEGWIMPEICLRKKNKFAFTFLKFVKANLFRQIVAWLNASSTFIFSSSTIFNSCWSVGWFFYFNKIRLKSQELMLIINILCFADFLKDGFGMKLVLLRVIGIVLPSYILWLFPFARSERI